MPRYLSKSRYKIALECPTKLFYTGKREYPNNNEDNTFLEALAQGGFQVGELAKLYYPGGHDIEDRGYDIPLQKTNQLLALDKVIIYEAAFLYKNLFIRADILVKNGNRIQLIEVKAKSTSGNDYHDFTIEKGYLEPKWRPYIYDVAYQKYVISNAYPEFTVSAYIMLADKNEQTSVAGLNQKFLLVTADDERTVCKVAGNVSPAALGNKILKAINLDLLIDKIWSGTDSKEPSQRSFIDTIHFFADSYEKDNRIESRVGRQCKECEYRCSPEEESNSKKSGFKECWKKQLSWSDAMFLKPLSYDIWDNRKAAKMMETGIYHMDKVTEDDLGGIKTSGDGSLSRTQRQWLQVQKTVNADDTIEIDKDGLRSEMSKWNFPLHFIDFETSMVAIPFHEGRRPYEGIAFQFSHHVVYEDHSIEHKSQYISVKRGEFPNFDFIRKLRDVLGNDDGTIFRYSPHENTFLNHILVQLNEADQKEVPDKDDLMQFIQRISHPTESSTLNWDPDRDMVDLWVMVKKYYYDPRMGGSNSIKAVLPAIMSRSNYLKTKYAKPIYGKNKAIKSLNFDEICWIQYDGEGNVISPYKLLQPLFEDMDQDVIDNFILDPNLADGGAAMTAWARMQFTQMGEVERKRAIVGLYRYCELDTFAMVLIWEYWNHLVNS